MTGYKAPYSPQTGSNKHNIKLPNIKKNKLGNGTNMKASYLDTHDPSSSPSPQTFPNITGDALLQHVQQT